MQACTRELEKRLLVLVAMFLTLGLAGLQLAIFTAEWPVWAFTAGDGLLVYLIHRLLRRYFGNSDQYLLPISVMLFSTGFVLLLRLNYNIALKQLIWLMVGLGAMVSVLRWLPSYRKLEEYKYLSIIIGLTALLGTVLFGEEAGGATSWIALGSLRFQPAELVKIFLVIFLASYLEEKRELLLVGTRSILGVNFPELRYVGPLLVMWGLSVVFLVFQRDLGTALLFFGTFLAMVYMATGRTAYVAGGLGLFGVSAGVLYLIFTHVQTRVAIWLNPWEDIENKGYQLTQSLFALATGGITGTGLGQGSPEFIPAVHTDFIFSAVGEELGFLGAGGVIILYLFLVYRGFKIALSAADDFGVLLAAGLTGLLAIQTFVILGGILKVIPLTGITLPFMSYGGSSLLTNFVLVALLLKISQESKGVGND